MIKDFEWAANPCEVVEPNRCSAPANGPWNTRTVCVACWRSVCMSCSIVQRRKGLYPNGRWCYECLHDCGRENVAAKTVYLRWLHEL